MTFDVESYLGAVERSVASLERDGQPAKAITLSRSYDTTIEDLWDAVSNPERIPRWFAPVAGDFRVGGRYQITGNAGGTITRCEAPTLFDLTWEFSGYTSWVEVRLASEGATRTRLTLVHIAHDSPHWEQYGPGAGGVGWELGLLGLALHLIDPHTKVDENEFGASPEGQAFMARSAEAWGEAHVASGADPDAARASAKRTAAFYAGAPAPEN